MVRVNRKRHLEMLRTPGYAMATGVYRIQDIYLVYLLRASSDQNTFYLTLKQKMEDGSREPLLTGETISSTFVK